MTKQSYRLRVAGLNSQTTFLDLILSEIPNGPGMEKGCQE
jgi:hypothetical protein